MKGGVAKLMKPSQDTELAKQCAAGDENAWRELVKRHGDLVFAVCYQVIGERAEAKDAAQEALVRALKAIDGFRPGGKLRPWLSKIAWNVSLRKAALRASPMVVGSDPDEEGAVSGLPDPFQVTERKELASQLRLAIAGLSTVERLVLELRLGQDMNYREIAQATDMPIGTVKTHLFRARKRVIEELSTKGERDELRTSKHFHAAGSGR
jgi:RNA polymerase sigma-70 factor (ECF subfamily)